MAASRAGGLRGEGRIYDLKWLICDGGGIKGGEIAVMLEVKPRSVSDTLLYNSPYSRDGIGTVNDVSSSTLHLRENDSSDVNSSTVL